MKISLCSRLAGLSPRRLKRQLRYLNIPVYKVVPRADARFHIRLESNPHFRPRVARVVVQMPNGTQA